MRMGLLRTVVGDACRTCGAAIRGVKKKFRCLSCVAQSSEQPSVPQFSEVSNIQPQHRVHNYEQNPFSTCDVHVKVSVDFCSKCEHPVCSQCLPEHLPDDNPVEKPEQLAAQIREQVRFAVDRNEERMKPLCLAAANAQLVRQKFEKEVGKVAETKIRDTIERILTSTLVELEDDIKEVVTKVSSMSRDLKTSSELLQSTVDDVNASQSHLRDLLALSDDELLRSCSFDANQNLSLKREHRCLHSVNCSKFALRNMEDYESVFAKSVRKAILSYVSSAVPPPRCSRRRRLRQPNCYRPKRCEDFKGENFRMVMTEHYVCVGYVDSSEEVFVFLFTENLVRLDCSWRLKLENSAMFNLFACHSQVIVQTGVASFVILSVDTRGIRYLQNWEGAFRRGIKGFIRKGYSYATWGASSLPRENFYFLGFDFNDEFLLNCKMLNVNSALEPEAAFFCAVSEENEVYCGILGRTRDRCHLDLSVLKSVSGINVVRIDEDLCVIAWNSEESKAVYSKMKGASGFYSVLIPDVGEQLISMQFYNGHCCMKGASGAIHFYPNFNKIAQKCWSFDVLA